MTAIPDDIMAAAWRPAFEAVSQVHTLEAAQVAIARAILAERERCADWCDKTAFLEWEQGELRAQRAVEKVRNCIISGDDV